MNFAMDIDEYDVINTHHSASNNILNNDVLSKVLNYHSAFKNIPAYYKPAGVCVDKIVKLKRDYGDDDREDSDEDREDDKYVIGNNEDDGEEDFIESDEEDAIADNYKCLEYYNDEDVDDDDDEYVTDNINNVGIVDALQYKKKITDQQLAITDLVKEAAKLEHRVNRHIVYIPDAVFDCRRRYTTNNGCTLTIQTATAEAVNYEIEEKNKVKRAKTTSTTANTTVVAVDYTSANYADSGNLSKQLWEMAPIKEGAYGDIRQQETKVDPKVRKARDYIYADNHFSCSAKLLEMLASKWSDNMYPCQSDLVTVVPYKINCYDPLGCFAIHVDTPDVDMVGTILLGLGQTDIDGFDDDTSITSHLCFHNNDGEQSWDPKFGDVCMFYSDVPHTVIANGRYRATVAFKVFSKNRVDNVHSDLLKLARTTLPKRPIGFLLSREYTHDSTAMKGVDGLFNEIVHQSDLYEEVKLVSVLLKTHRICYTEVEPARMYSNVYIITSDRIAKSCIGRSKQKRVPEAEDAIRGIDFYRVAVGYRWSLNVDKGAENAGNECRAQEINSVYLHKALIAYPKKKGANPEVQADTKENKEKKREANFK